MYRVLLIAILSVLCAGAASADVRIDEKTQVRFEGLIGRMAGLFGGKATREGAVSIVAVRGDRKLTRNGETAQLIDLQEEKIYDIDFKDRSYRVTTFAEIRRQMEEARKKAAEQMAKEPAAAEAPRESQEPPVDIDVTFKESGQRREINGFNAREVVMTIGVREKGRKLEESGGMVLTGNMWLTPKIAAMNEVAAFDLRYAQKLNILAMFDAQQVEALAAMYPMMKQAMARFQTENVNMDGSAVLTTMTLQAVADPETAREMQQQSAKEQAPPTSVGGLGGALAGRFGKRVLGGNKADSAPAAPSTPGRATVMTMTHEVVTVATTVADADMAIPAGFREKK